MMGRSLNTVQFREMCVYTGTIGRGNGNAIRTRETPFQMVLEGQEDDEGDPEEARTHGEQWPQSTPKFLLILFTRGRPPGGYPGVEGKRPIPGQFS